MRSFSYSESDQYAYIAQLINLGLEVSEDPVINYQKLVENYHATSKGESQS
jgi:hypothetical protein